MRPAVITSLLAIGLVPVQASPFFNFFNDNPIASAINGFLPSNIRQGGGGNAASTAVAPTTAAPAPATTAAGSAPTSAVSLNGAKGKSSAAPAAATSAAAAQSTGANAIFNPNAPAPQSPTAPAPFATGAPALTNRQQATSLSSACSAWISDTGVVSNFQNIGAGLVLNAQQFKSQAAIALAAEKDELLHKAVIDQIIGLDPGVSLANLTLTDGSFQGVINGLQDMTTNGPARVGDIAAINRVRCVQVLPAIDTYCQTAAKFAAKQGVTVLALAAVRPSVCTPNGVIGGGGAPSKQKRPYFGGAFNRLKMV